MYNTITHILRGRKCKVSTIAWTGIAANLLIDGKTVHSTFSLPLELNDRSSLCISLESLKAQDLKKTDIFIWDESPMASKYALDAIDRFLKKLMENNLPFGGKLFLLGGGCLDPFLLKL